MDSSAPPACSPPLPPYVVEVVDEQFALFKHLSKAASAKIKALKRLKTTPPKSLASKTELQLTKTLQDSDPAGCAIKKPT
ncbi:hypothetical protein LEN26_020394 [Aphanomyces euteiches]|nr:hypothetical protein LEN26_020394 [Aphanomyces euteiches]KAH9123194.1 hypothetical protein AeMF1_005763 [Aphanomyces euteiches]KAH9180118.1 hypothetical protein AeNC1_017238 [Aphanomyces euteiches]